MRNYPEQATVIPSFSNLVNFANPAAPKGLIRSAEEWVKRSEVCNLQLRQPQPTAAMKMVFPAEENKHLVDYAFEKTPFDEFQSVRWTKSPAAVLFYLQGSRVLGDEGAIVSKDNKIFCEFTQPPANRWLEHSCFKRRRIPEIQKLSGWYATISFPESKFFFHWMIEALPRMALLDEYLGILDGIFVPSPLFKYHKESLHALGIDNDKLIPLDVNSHYQPQHLFVPKTFAMYNPPSWMHRWFKEKYLAPARVSYGVNDYSEKIYISREDAPARKVSNESEVMTLMSKHGFKIIRLSEHPFLEQVAIFNRAEVIVASHGAGLSNIVFCQPGTKLLEILPPRWMAPCFFALAGSVGCSYRHVVAKECDAEIGSTPQRNNLVVSIESIERALAEIQSS